MSEQNDERGHSNTLTKEHPLHKNASPAIAPTNMPPPTAIVFAGAALLGFEEAEVG